MLVEFPASGPKRIVVSGAGRALPIHGTHPPARITKGFRSLPGCRRTRHDLTTPTSLQAIISPSIHGTPDWWSNRNGGQTDVLSKHSIFQESEIEVAHRRLGCRSSHTQTNVRGFHQLADPTGQLFKASDGNQEA